MATYHITFTSMASHKEIGNSRQIDPYKMFAEVLQNTPHTFIFVITRGQWPLFLEIFKLYGWDKFVVFEMPEFIRNPRYRPPDYPQPRLKLIVMKGQGSDES